LVQDPECVDKDLLRRWYVSHCDPYDASLALPEVPADLVAELSRRYGDRLSEWVVVP
jgi:phosphoribosylaminoimidazole-succinocarboxamide synthase